MTKKFDAKKFSQLHDEIIRFNHLRGWDPSPQNLAKSIVIEAAELLEHFQWDDYMEYEKNKDLKEVAFEGVDVLWYLINFFHKMGIDLNEAIELKLEHNNKKYPAEKFQGKHNSEFYYQQKAKYREGKK